MTTIALDHLRQHVRMEVQKHLDGKNHRRPWLAMAYRGTPGWTGPQSFEEKGFRFRVAVASSLLELRCQLIGLDPAGLERVVIVADVPPTKFHDDIRSRLLHADLCEIEPIHLLMAEFRATRFDARIKADQHLALALLQNRPADGFPAVMTGVLDLTTIWSSVCTYVLGLPNGDPTPRDLLAWSVDDASAIGLRTAEGSLRASALQWLYERNPLSKLLVSIATTIPPSDLIPIGLVCGVVYHENASQHADLLRAQGRLEQITGHVTVTLKDAREWHAEAAQALSTLDLKVQLRLRKRSDALIAQVGAADFAGLSDIAPLGYHQRLVAFAKTLRLHLEAKASDADLLEAAQAVRRHWDGQVDTHRQLKVEMATRIARWLRTPTDVPTTLPEGMRLYRDRIAFVDWARHGVVGGDPVVELQQAYAALHDKALIRREAFNRRFAELVVDWNRTPDQHSDILRVEDINRRIVAEAASDHKVLVLVMDGLSWAVAQELVGHLENQYWTLRSRTVDGLAIPCPAMTTLPSVTEFGRTSLLCGHLARGDAGDERRGFAENHELRSVSSSSNPPVLFHKKDLEEAGRQGLGTQITDAIANNKQRIVGVVVNAVDDYLMKDDGGRRSWDLESIRVLGDLLAAAEQSKRAIVMCSDHGHVLDHWAAGATGSPDGGERWHTNAPKEGDLVVSGPRLELYGSTITAPWSERIRYSGKKNGYHGGLSPQELIAPCLVLAKDDLPGWSEIHLAQPAWWRMEAEELPVVTSAAAIQPLIGKPIKGKPRNETAGQQSLFDQPAVAATTVETTATWHQRLLASPVYHQSSAQAGRRRPDDAMVLKLLEALDAAPGCQVSERALAELLNVPAIRMSGIIAQVARMLNVESYRILSYTDDRGHIRLDRNLALTQFELGAIS